ncbi:helix-turn-helix domain-containing protein [Streptomyces aidingensis]|uniref:PEP-CTERM protein-sorting domain-containing protein n=1 Tax=Streptomyces aidingensis TaxID=910347 RepID=A0A1I1TX81_9ACTN|nr:helix-turn-helix transcriptional regulator [Streptomyces aidingensis]SFD61908.1 PEP-CTERM protein-sorting domain-containing protein [Streptomyces aidingensis]
MAERTFGERLRNARVIAGLTQTELARAAGISVSTVRKLEQGAHAEARLETAHALARVLGVPTTALLAAEETAPPSIPPGPWEQLRAAILRPGADRVPEPATAAGVAAVLDSVVSNLVHEDLAGVAAVLPGLLRDAEAAAEADPGAAAVYSRALMTAGRVMIQTRHYDAAAAAFDRAEAGVDGVLHRADMVESRCWLLLRSGRLAQARELALRWAAELEPRLSAARPDDLIAWGVVLGRVAAAASRDGRPDESEAALRMAQAAAVMLAKERPRSADGSRRTRSWGPLTVAMQRTEQAVVEDRPDVALRLARGIGGRRLAPTVGHRNRHLLDVADAQVKTRRYGEAVETLLDVAEAAPQWLPHQRYAKEIVGKIVERRRKLSPEMQTLARAVRLPM